MVRCLESPSPSDSLTHWSHIPLSCPHPLKAGSNQVPELLRGVQNHSPTPGQAQRCPVLSGGRHNPPTLFRYGSKVSKPGLYLSSLDSDFVTDWPRGSWNHTETLPRLPRTSLEAHQFPGAANSTSLGREGGWKRKWDLQPETPLSKNSSLLYQQPVTVQRAALNGSYAREWLPSPISCQWGCVVPCVLMKGGPCLQGVKRKSMTPQLTAASFTTAIGRNSLNVHGWVSG